ncbi:MAG TPA: prolyl oligopeptidase family serine peptidase [Puia sp.]|nr:prolyl oligopeptidase family serine peptidase [Puia sp.]
MKKNIWLCIFCFVATLLSAQNNAGSKKNRPQTPQAPFDYRVDSVEYDNADKTIHLGATFTYPKTGKSFVTAVMITGSGLQDRDETIFDHKPFAVIADYLTRNGFAVLRVDDRNMGKSKGDIKNVTSLDFADDVMTSISYLLHRKEVDKNKIGVIGHSEGGFISPIIYTKWPKLAFIISLAGTGVSGAEILLRQQTDPVKNLVDSASFHAFYLLTQKTLQVIHDNSDKPDSIVLNMIKKSYVNWKSSQPDTVLITLHANVATPEMYARQISPELQSWLKYFIATDPDQFWQMVKCPVLALNGEKDIQVYANQNIPAIAASLQKAGDKHVTTKIFPGLNHLFQHCTKCTVAEYKELDETFSPEVLQVMGDWLKKNIN